MENDEIRNRERYLVLLLEFSILRIGGATTRYRLLSVLTERVYLVG